MWSLLSDSCAARTTGTASGRSWAAQTTATLGVVPHRSSARTTTPLIPRIWPPLIVVVALFLTYGYEIVTSSLTLDEELYAAGARNIDTWISEGRWTMALIYLIVPSIIVPVVSAGIGVGLTGLALWIIARRFLGLGQVTAAAAVSLAATVPVLAFLFSFSTIAHGIGVAAILTIVWCWGIRSGSIKGYATAVIAGASAVGIYDSFLAVLATLSLALIVRRPQPRTTIVAVVALPVALVISRAVSWLVQSVTGVPQGDYVGGFLDPIGLLTDPFGRIRAALGATWHTLTLSADRFGQSSPWLIVTLAIIGTLALLWAIRAPASAPARALRLVALALIASLPVASEALSPGNLNLRSMVYLPFVILVLAAFAARGVGLLPRRPARVLVTAALCGLIVLAVVGHAAITNRLFASANASYALDRRLAFNLGEEAQRLTPDGTSLPLPIVIAGLHSWPETTLLPSRETLGISFFEKSSAGSVRVISFLQVEGVAVTAASEAQIRDGHARLNEMPAYPRDGWIDVVDGVLLVRLGN